MEQENVRVDLTGNALEALQRLSDEMVELNGKVDDLDGSFDRSAVGIVTGMNQAREAISALSAPMREGRDAVYGYDHAMHELEAITGVTGDNLELIGDSAVESSKKFGGDATSNLQTYQVLLSKLDPNIANKPAALASMGDSVQILAKTMQGDAVGATTALTSAMNQFGVSLDNPELAAVRMREMMNQIAAGAQVGSQEVPQVAQALDQAGAIAKNAGVSFTETNAAIQVLGKFGKEGAEGGVALRNVLQIMGKEEFLPKKVRAALETAGVDIGVISDRSLTLGQRLGELNKIKDNGSLLGGMFGMENVTAITGLLESQPLLEQYTLAIEENATAGEDMAAVIAESYLEASNRINAQIDAVRLGVFSLTGDALPWLDAIGGGFVSITEVAPGLMAVYEGMKLLTASTKLQSVWTGIATTAQTALNFAMNLNPIGLAVAGLAALAGGVAYAWNNFEGFRGAVYGLWEGFKTVFGNIADFFGDMLAPVFEAIDLFQKGDYSGAAIAAGKGALNLATIPLQFAVAVGSGDITKGAGDAYAGGKEKGKASFLADNPVEAGSSAPSAAGSFIPSGGEVATTNQSTSQAAGQSVEGSVKGGKIITVHIGQLIGTIENHIADGQESASRIKELATEALFSAVRDFELQQ